MKGLIRIKTKDGWADIGDTVQNEHGAPFVVSGLEEVNGYWAVVFDSGGVGVALEGFSRHFSRVTPEPIEQHAFEGDGPRCGVCDCGIAHPNHVEQLTYDSAILEARHQLRQAGINYKADEAMSKGTLVWSFGFGVVAHRDGSLYRVTYFTPEARAATVIDCATMDEWRKAVAMAIEASEGAP